MAVTFGTWHLIPTELVCAAEVCVWGRMKIHNEIARREMSQAAKQGLS